MAKFLRNEEGMGYLIVNFMDLMHVTDNCFPICDSCLAEMIGDNDIILVPSLNSAYCNHCGMKVVAKLKNYPEEKEFNKAKEDQWKKAFMEL